MQTLISLLRGINMTGHNSVKMKDLSELYNNLGFTNVETYIQSGNVIFSCPESRSSYDISTMLERSILEKFGYNVPVMIRTIVEMKKLMADNPFLDEDNFDASKMAVIFLHEEPTGTQIQKVSGVSYPPDKFKISGTEICIYCPNGFGRTKLYTNFFEQKMGVVGTARNWKTITAIMDHALKR
jgi:uncharacterized protein (DUF1697 family)